MADWPLERDGFEPLEDGLERTYRRGRRDLARRGKDPTAENLHEWRKRVKDLWYHCAILERSWKPVMSALADEAHELSDRLGDDHDLAVLLAWAHENAEALDGADRMRPSRQSADAATSSRPRPSPTAPAVRRQARRVREAHRELVACVPWPHWSRPVLLPSSS